MDKFVADLDDAESRANEALELAEAQKKINQTKSKLMDSQRIVDLQKELDEVKADVGTKFKTLMDGAKKSVVITILKSKIQLEKKIIEGDFDPTHLLTEVREWELVLASLTGESSKNAEQVHEEKMDEDSHVGEKEKVVVVLGDEGINA